jgi:hypothetical protein
MLEQHTQTTFLLSLEDIFFGYGYLLPKLKAVGLSLSMIARRRSEEAFR